MPPGRPCRRPLRRRMPDARSTSPRAAARPSGPPRSARRAPRRPRHAPPRARSPSSGPTWSGVLRVPAPPASPEAWITLWGGDDGRTRGDPPVTAPAEAAAERRPARPQRSPAPAPARERRRHPGRRLLARGWRDPLPATRRGRGVRAGRDRPAAPAGGRAGPRTPRGPVRPAARSRPAGGPVAARSCRRIRLIGIEPVGRSPTAPARGPVGRARREGSWSTSSSTASGPEPDGRLARLRLPAERADAERRADPGGAGPAPDDGRNLRYLDLFQELVRKRRAPAAGALSARRRPVDARLAASPPTSRGCWWSTSPA